MLEQTLAPSLQYQTTMDMMTFFLEKLMDWDQKEIY